MFAGESNQLREAYLFGIQQIPLLMIGLRTPVIAMVNGPAIGAGCDLAAMCDLRIASDKAIFAETFTKVGLVPGDGGAYFLSRLIGLGKAMEMFLTSESVNAEEALRIGLVNKVVSTQDLVKETELLVETICALPPIAVQMTKRAVLHAQENSLSSHLELMAALQGITQRSSDHFKAVDGILGKKKPTFDHR